MLVAFGVAVVVLAVMVAMVVVAGFVVVVVVVLAVAGALVVVVVPVGSKVAGVMVIAEIYKSQCMLRIGSNWCLRLGSAMAWPPSSKPAPVVSIW
jgi:hypothetical protein